MNATALEPELAKLHRASLSWATTCCRGDSREAEEVLQASYLKIIDGRARFDGRSSVKTWLFSVIRITAMEGRRKAWLRAGLLAEWLLGAAASDGHEGRHVRDVAEQRQDRSRVLEAMHTLPERQRQVLELVFYHDQSISEAATTMQVSVGSARVHYERGKKRLRDVLRTMGLDDG